MAPKAKAQKRQSNAGCSSAAAATPATAAAAAAAAAVEAEEARGAQLFIQTMLTVPPALQACCAALQDSAYDDRRYSPRGCSHGLRAMRLLCTEMSTIQGVGAKRYMVRLSLSARLWATQLQGFGLMRNARLTHLGVVIPEGGSLDPVCSQNKTLSLQAEMLFFLLKGESIESLYIYTPPATLKPTDLPRMQTPQAPAATLSASCPRIKTLHLSGMFASSSIVPFQGVETLRVTAESTCVDSAKHLALPSLTKLELAPSPSPCPLVINDSTTAAALVAANADAVDASSIDPPRLKPLSSFMCDLVTCQSLKVLDISNREVDTEVWNLLPNSLEALVCGMEEPLTGSKSLLNLANISIHSRSFKHPLGLDTVASVLSLAPALTDVRLPKPRGEWYRADSSDVYLAVPTNHVNINFLKLLKRHIGNGLVVWGGVHLLFEAATDDHICMADFLAKMPDGMPCLSLLLESKANDPEDSYLPTDLPAKVPSLVNLGILSNKLVDTVNLSQLLGCTSLANLSLATRLSQEYTSLDLTLLTLTLSSLRVMQLHDNQDPSMAQRMEQHRTKLAIWQSPVTTVEVRLYTDPRLVPFV